MLRARLIACLCMVTAMAPLASPARAAGSQGAPGTNVEMPYLMAPLTGSDGTLSGYVYISSRLAASSPTVALEVRDKIAFIQDAFVRDVNRAPIPKPDDSAAVDKNAIAVRLLADARRVMGPGKVAGLTVVQLQIAPLHPQESTPSTTPMPDSAAANTP